MLNDAPRFEHPPEPTRAEIKAQKRSDDVDAARNIIASSSKQFASEIVAMLSQIDIEPCPVAEGYAKRNKRSFVEELANDIALSIRGNLDLRVNE